MSPPTWQETYLGGSEEAEARLFDELAEEIKRAQDKLRARQGLAVVGRPFHAKSLGAVDNARFEVRPDLAADLRVGFLQAGTTHRATVRFSNAKGQVRSDKKRDLRGVAIRVHVRPEADQDLLLTNAPASHADDARQFMHAAMATAIGGPRGVAHLVKTVGPVESARMAWVLAQGFLHKVTSVATETYWSRAATAVGPTAVRFTLTPLDATGPSTSSGDDYLRQDLAERLRRGEVSFSLEAQRYVDEVRTPIERGRASWDERDSPPEPVARLTLPRQDLDAPEALATEAAIDGLAFSPWNTTDPLRPLGNLNRARRQVYAASAAHRGS